MTPFWQLAHQGTAIITTGGERISYPQLADRADEFANRLGKGRRLLLVEGRNNLDCLLAYLAVLRRGHVLMLQPAGLSRAALEAQFIRYQPHFHLDRDGNLHHRHDRSLALSPDLCLLLSTSGSTGSPKQVMLSAANLQANAESICAYLPILASDRAITSLPWHYSYGLSILNTHLLAGASLLLSEESVLSRPFWDCFKAWEITTLAGVPATYDILLRLRFERKTLPTLRYLTQAGGRLAPEKVAYLVRSFGERGVPFYVMYGQTEAAARMAWLPPAKALEHPDCIGQAIPGGQLGLRADTGDHFPAMAGQRGELIYKGGNVMLGYAGQLADLAAPTPAPLLATGDLAECMGNGLFRITGRLKRFIKLQGNRLNLDELEKQLNSLAGRLACAGTDDNLQLFITDSGQEHQLRQALQAQGIHATLYRIHSISGLPLTPSEKIDYQILNQYG